MAKEQQFMGAVRLFGPGLAPRLESVPRPVPQDGHVVLQVAAAGVCHTELQLFDGTLNPGVWPITLGHEIAGRVVEGPPNLVGQTALVYYGNPCGECEWCANGQEQVCPNSGPQPGLSSDGGFADFVRVPVNCMLPLPPGLSAVAAAPLGCAAATAYHALHGVAQLCGGDTAVVYGAGGVGLALIQLGRLAGLRVLAVGRDARKLELAEEFGAEPISAAAGDPAIAVRRLTHGEGAHCVFDLVGSQSTIRSSVDMLRRQGKLVLVGYGPDGLALNPLHLVLREIRLLGSLGNTRMELAEVLRLAGNGSLRVPIAGEYALADAAEVLAELRSGNIAGRAVLIPGLKSQRLSRAVTAQSPRFTSVEAAVPARVPHQAAISHCESAESIEEDILALVERGATGPRDDDEFDDLAYRLFVYQYVNNAAYRAWCDMRHGHPTSVHAWREIPSMPIAAFKQALLACETPSGAVEFNSSGTTNPEIKSRHVHPNLGLYDANAVHNFESHVIPDGARLPYLVLFPSRQELPHSSLAHWLTLMVERFGSQGSEWFVTADGGLNAEALANRLACGHEAVGILGASFGLVHFLEYCRDRDLRFQLPSGSRVMDTGGYKGRSREYPKAELYAMVDEFLGVPTDHIVNMYGLTEHGTQFLDVTLRLPGFSHKFVPPWARTLVVHPETLEELPPGEPGLLLHFDLINRNSVLAVLSEDIGLAVDGGFELLGRASGVEARGCSIAVDELIAMGTR